MKKSFRILLTLVLVLVTLLSLTACISDCDAGMHAFVEIPIKEATCTESGNVAYKRCRVCELCLDENGKQISLANTIIPAKGHELDEHPASTPTCTADGTVQYWECKTCGKKFSDANGTKEIAIIVDGATGHVNTTHKDAIPATCTTEGTKAHDVCDDCGALLVDGKVVTEKDLIIEIDTTAHKFGTWADEVPATCTTEGTLGYQDCEYCNKHFDINGKEITDLTIGKTTHTYDQEVENEQYLVSKATCKDYAVYHKSCKCGAIGDETFNGTTLAEHTYGDWIVGKDAACDEDGEVAHYHCSVCNKNYDKSNVEIENIVITALGHDYGDLVEKQLATCTTKGVDEHYHCTACGDYFKNDADKTPTTLDELTLVDATAHNWGDWTVTTLATCSAKGVETRVCTHDSTHVETRDIAINTNAHKFGTWNDEIPATCVNKGTKGHKDCEYCKNHFDNDGKLLDSIVIDIDSTAHKPASNWSHDESGHYHACENGCGARLDETAHNPETITGKPATCTESGLTDGSKCKDCGYIITEQQTITAHGHKYGNLIAKQPATCKATGREAHYYCENCKTYFTESKVVTNWADLEIAKDYTNHTALTTGDKDETYHYGAHCTDCGYTQEQEEHKGQGWIHAVDINGKHYHYQQCSCGYILAKADCTPGVPVDENVHDSNCLETGTKDVVTYCTVCGEEISRQTGVVIEKKSHTYGDWITETPATCVEEGTLGHYHCSACEHNFDSSKNELSSLTIAVDTTNGHNWQEVEEKLATCTDDGYSAHKECTLCHETTGKTVLPKGHVIVNHNGQAPTCTEAGWNAYETCSRCEYTTKVEIPATGHVHTTHKDEIPATCTTAGTKAHDVCDDCGALLVDGKVVEVKDLVIEIDESSHKFGDWINEVLATCVKEGTKGHKDCEYCKNHFDSDGAEIVDLTIAVDTTNGHKASTDWKTTDDGKHYHTCKNGCGTHLDEAEHTDIVKFDDDGHWAECSICGTITTVKENHNVEGGKCSAEGCLFIQSTSNITLTSIPDAIEIAKALANNGTTTESYFVFGRVKSITASSGSAKIADANGNIFTLYGLKAYDGTSYNSIVKQNDIIVVYGQIINYKGNTPEIQNAIVVERNGEVLVTAQNILDKITFGDTIDAQEYDLPIYDVGSISWVSSNAEVFAIDNATGKATITASKMANKTIILTATATFNGVTATKDYTFTIPKDMGIRIAYLVATKLGVENKGELSAYAINGVKFTFDKSNGSNVPVYNTDGAALRLYNKNTITITAPKGTYITKIEFVFGTSDGDATITSGDITIESNNSNTWSGNSNSVVFKIGNSGKQRRIASIEVTYCSHESTEIKPIEGNSEQHQKVCSGCGAQIEMEDHIFTFESINGLQHSTTCACGYTANSDHVYENHACKDCEHIEPSYTVNIVVPNGVTVALSGEKVEGKENAFYRNTTVTVTITNVVDNYIAEAEFDGSRIVLTDGVGEFIVTDDGTLTVSCVPKAEEHECEFTKYISCDETTHTFGCSYTGCNKTETTEHVMSVYEQTNDKEHTVKCSATGCTHLYTEEHVYGENHECVCGMEEPTVCIQINNQTNDIVTVTMSADGQVLERDQYTYYVGTSVTLTIALSAETKVVKVTQGETDVTLTDNAYTFTATADATFVITVADKPVVKVGTLVTDYSTLSAGDQIIIVAKDSNYALSTTQNDNNRGQAAVTKSNNTINTVGDDVQIITLEVGKTDGTWSFNTDSGYLYAASSSKNYLRTETTLSNNSSWSITIAEDGAATITAQGTNTRNLLKYNSQSKLFSCYSSGQQDVVIYKLG